ncbi:MAG: TonB-dependent receptor [Vicinamibacteria bacterium]|nr:TonB-dependent receptor [Vicinamibacteria bacterium]MBP9945342.1 TonB-dependent receptor [Vicinamibacteria bacterium]
MKNILSNWRRVALAMALLLSMNGLAAAQVTTGAITGAVVDESGGTLPGASVTATHEQTGARFSAVTGTDGRYLVLNVPAGGPYSVSVSMPGFRDAKKTGVVVPLGDSANVPFRVVIQTMTETVEVVAERSIISPTASGAASNVSQETIASMPTISRGLEDFARLSPYFVSSGGGQGDGASALSVAGRNSKYNNVQIDGAVNNDLFGLSDSGTPGGQTETQPISLDAVQELQLVVSPYDVRQGGFAGGGLNAVTKSGTNTFRGTAFYYFRNRDLAGPGPCPANPNVTCASDDARKLSEFSDKQFGGNIGGPIIKNKAFFFVNVDIGRRKQPTGFSADGSTGTNWVALGAARPAGLAQILSIAQSKYGYNPGPTNEFVREIPSDKVIAKIDFTLNDRHRLTFRHNYVKGSNDIGTPNNNQFRMPDAIYKIRSKTNSSVVQLNSTFGSAVNELRLAYTTVRDQRDGSTKFPAMRVDIDATTSVIFGRETFSTANELDQDVIELTNDFTIPKGKHLITIGTHNEFFKFRNLFIRDNFGSYRFSSIANFEAGLAQQYDYSFSATSNPKQAAAFKVNQIGFYIGDLFRATPRLTLNFGIRIDVPRFPDKPTANPAAQAAFGYATNVVPGPSMPSPRFGFNYDIGGASKQQLRGGIGIFAGRTPYVWLSNQYGNTGIEFTRIGAGFNTNNRIPFVANPDAQPKTVTGASSGAFTNEVDFVDPDYQYPQVARATLGYDRDLGFLGLVATVEGVYSKSLKDIAYQNLNFVKGPNTRPDGRPIFVRANSSFSDLILLTDTSEGYAYNVNAKVERPFRNGWSALLGYSYGDSYSVNDGTSSQAASNWGNAYTRGDPNDVETMRSRFAAGHRIQAAVSRDFKLGNTMNLQLSAYYDGASGRPYHFTIPSDFNGDGRTTNDLFYVPRNADEVVVINGTWDQLNAYIEADPGLRNARGTIMKKHAAWGPWVNGLDLSSILGFNVAGRKVELRADVRNLLNLISKDWGVVDFATFGDLAPIPITIASNGKMQYNLATINSATYIKYDRDNLRSRWTAQLSARVRF